MPSNHGGSNFGKQFYQQGEVLTIVDGKFKGFVGTVVSSPQHNITGHLVLRRKAKSGALHQQEIFLGQEKEDLKAQIREVLTWSVLAARA